MQLVSVEVIQVHIAGLYVMLCLCLLTCMKILEAVSEVLPSMLSVFIHLPPY